MRGREGGLIRYVLTHDSLVSTTLTSLTAVTGADRVDALNR